MSKGLLDGLPPKERAEAFSKLSAESLHPFLTQQSIDFGWAQQRIVILIAKAVYQEPSRAGYFLPDHLALREILDIAGITGEEFGKIALEKEKP